MFGVLSEGTAKGVPRSFPRILGIFFFKAQAINQQPRKCIDQGGERKCHDFRER